MTSKAKEQGNTAFKAGDYASAVGHYTSAILEDRNEPTYYLNRAAAYLKLGKDVDAENDCTRVLALNPKNTKGLFRRAQARMSLGKFKDAQADLQEAAKIEPTNESVKQELQRVNSLLENKGKQKAVPQDSAAPYRRRIPIKIVEPPPSTTTEPATVAPKAPMSPAKAPKASTKESQTGTTAESLLNPISSRPLASSKSPSPEPTVTTAPPAPTFTEAKQAGEQKQDTKPVARVGGGIFRANGVNTIFNRDPAVAAASASPPTKEKRNVPPPATLFDFNRVWETARTSQERYDLVASLPSDKYPSLFQTSLEPSLFASIVETLSDKLDDHHTVEVAVDSLNAFTKVPRFDTVLLFLSKQEREKVEQLVQKLAGKIGGSTVLDAKWQKFTT